MTKHSFKARRRRRRRHVNEDFWSAHLGASTFASGGVPLVLTWCALIATCQCIDITSESSWSVSILPYNTRKCSGLLGKGQKWGGTAVVSSSSRSPQHGVGDTDGWDAGITWTCVGAEWTTDQAGRLPLGGGPAALRRHSVDRDGRARPYLRKRRTPFAQSRL
ncbi:hypothetical protein BJV74DRAFT_847290 [Russula compacta]|nr:hypothetical protein BJV74DRAFT_847290 [Russula compacta]